MKNLWKNRLLSLLIAAVPFGVQAQSSDDLYYDPVWDVSPEPVVYVQETPPQQPVTYREELPEYRDDYDDYDYWDDQGYFYSSRIRRFHNPYRGFDYYDPVYTDLGFYDPWIMPGSSIYINIGGGADYWTWRRFNRFRWGPSFGFGGWNTWGWRNYYDSCTYNSWGAFRVYDPWFDPYWGGACFNRGWNWGWNTGWGWNNPWGWNNGWGNNYFINNNYFFNDVYGQPGYWYGNQNGTLTNNPKGTYYGPRNDGARSGPSRGTVRDPEYTSGGIPILKERIGGPAAAGLRDQDNGNGANGVIRDRDRIGESGLNQNRPNVENPRNPGNLDPVRQDPSGPATNPGAPSNRDQLGQRDRWSDIEKKEPVRQAPRPGVEERSRDSYRDNYLRNRTKEPVTRDPRTLPDPRTRTRPDQNQRTRPDSNLDRSRQRQPQTFPDRSDRNSRSNDRPSYQAPSPSRQMPSRTFDRPSRSNSNSSGGFNSGGNSRSNNRSSGSSSGSSSGGGRKSGRGGDQ